MSSRVSINGGVVVNVMSFLTSKKPGKNMEDLIPTNMKMASFTGEKSNALWSSYSRCCGGTKGSEICLLCHGRQAFILYTEGSYFVGNRVETIETNKNHFLSEVKMFEAFFHRLNQVLLGFIRNTKEYWELLNYNLKVRII